MSAEPGTDRELLRHCLATIAYRGGKVIRDAPEAYINFQAGPNGRTPLQIVAHIGDLLDWALSMVKGQPAWRDAPPTTWAQEASDFFDALKRLDDYLASAEPLNASPEKLFQGPLSDALTHVGQLAMLRRMSGVPIRGENYYKAEIAKGRVGEDQAAARLEF
jgi:hypothetical protein